MVFESPGERHDHAQQSNTQQRDEEITVNRWIIAARALLRILSEVADRPINELHLWARERGWQTEGSVAFGSPQASLLRDLAVFVECPLSNALDLSPASLVHPASIMHWRVLMRIVASINPAQRARVRSIPFPDLNDDEIESIPLPPAIDAHCHYTTLLSRGQGILQHGPFNPTGIIDNRVFPHEWSQPLPTIQQCRTTFGVHPSLATRPDFEWGEVVVAATTHKLLKAWKRSKTGNAL